jgi:hypothetical protein
MQTQWNVETVVAGRVFFTRHHGLKYEVLPAMAGGLAIAVDECLLDAIGFMEGEALRIFDARATAALKRV